MDNERNTDGDNIWSVPVAGDALAGGAPPRARQPWGRLLKAVLDLAGEHAELVRHVERDWATATFSGSRHALTLCFCGVAAVAAGDEFIAALPDHEFVIPRWLVADAQIVGIDDRQLPEPRLIVEVALLLLDRA